MRSILLLVIVLEAASCGGEDEQQQCPDYLESQALLDAQCPPATPYCTASSCSSRDGIWTCDQCGECRVLIVLHGDTCTEGGSVSSIGCGTDEWCMIEDAVPRCAPIVQGECEIDEHCAEGERCRFGPPYGAAGEAIGRCTPEGECTL